ncbi:hypothetical protein CBR_g50001 [Chara braunii]|nr:hypothetical protein CBR_g50001 [Chara braunii]|eukprot:GBG65210.1 hypothetical protein CBR_g50001 [Chara braunii]
MPTACLLQNVKAWLIGELTAAVAADGTLSEEQLKEFQVAREKGLAELLKARLQPWVDGDKQKFIEEAQAEMAGLLIEPFGIEILQCVGYVYQHKANMLLGLHHSHLKLPGHIASLRQQGHTFLRRVRAQVAVAKAAEFTERYERERQSANNSSLNEEGFPLFINSLWAVSVLDIESTLRHVVTLVVVDESVPKDVRAARAKGIAVLGKIFQEA